MEFSSPLAALRPQSHAAWGSRKDLPVARAVYQNYQSYSNSFDFKSMSMQQTKPVKHDYFSLRPVRGSSPTSSLTADLDANFHIDKSPQAPTPRRSLFTTDPSKPQDDIGRRLTSPTYVEGAITPPIVPSSSPGFDGMDMSPLPHKPPYFAAQVTLTLPSPDETLNNDVELLSPDHSAPQPQPPLQALSVQPPTFLPLPERKRPVTRPSLSRSKGYSTSHIPQRPYSAETQLPPFRFGNVASRGISCSSTPSLLESFSESPVDDITPKGITAMPPPPRRTTLNGGTSRTSGSPSTSHVRKPSAGRPACVRPQRKVMRRSLSMFQHPNDVMKEEQNTFEPQATLASVMDIDREHKPKIPQFVPEPDSLPRISQETMADVLNNKYASEFNHVMVIDCRFEYEYSGGHIENAVNFNDKQQLANELFHGRVLPPSTLLILHCEYSLQRAPLMAKFIRNYDRNINAANYPQLTYPELYILDGGYSAFYLQQPQKCIPQNYVLMEDKGHEQACERGMAKVKQQRQKLFRNQTFAFGQNHDDEMHDSPTAQGRGSMGGRSQSTFSISMDIAEGIGQSFARRMASYP